MKKSKFPHLSILNHEHRLRIQLSNRSFSRLESAARQVSGATSQLLIACKGKINISHTCVIFMCNIQ